MSSKPTYVLGTGLSHDGSACLLKDGRVCVAVEKERLTRKKHDGFNDVESVQYCLDAEGITIDQVELVVQNANFSMLERGPTWFHGPRPFTEQARVVSISHHLAHAYSALGLCPFDEASVLVVDGCGSAFDECIDLAGGAVGEQPPAELQHLHFEKDSYYTIAGGSLRTVFKDFSPWGMRLREYPMYPNTTLHSVGGLYGAASAYALQGMDDPGKLMGLAPYGRPGAREGELFELREGRVFVRYEHLASFDRPSRSYRDFLENFQYYADIARWVQREVERALLYLVDERYRVCPSRNLAFAGGVALNAVANRRILQEGPFENVFFVPAAGDNGLALGCAYYGWLHVLGRERVRHTGSSCFGVSYGDAVVARALEDHASKLDIQRSADVAVSTAEWLARGKTVGFFQGGSEFGPRALGHRSILADPRSAEIRDHINAAIKFREDFRPFAPAVPVEDAATYFECEVESPYMILVAPVRECYRSQIPATVHRDGSCRLQTVDAATDPLFHRVLREFEQRSGVAVLLNTSFNRRGMPIVETPEHAIRFFLECALDVLIIGPFVVTKRDLPSSDPPEHLSRFFCDFLKPRLDAHWHEISATGGVLRLLVDGRHPWTVDLTGEAARAECTALGEVDTTFHLSAVALRELFRTRGQACAQLAATGQLHCSGNPRGLLLLERIAALGAP